MDETTEERLAAVERAVTDGDHALEAFAEAGDLADRVEQLEAEVETQDDRIAELEAATQALRGYVGNVRAVNEEVRQRADRALELAERTEETADDADRSPTRDRQSEELTLELANSDDTDSAADNPAQTETGGACDQSGGGQPASHDQPRTGQTTSRERRESRGNDGTCPLCDGDGTSSGPGSDGNEQRQLSRDDHREMPSTGTEPDSAKVPADDRHRAGLTDGGTVEGSGDVDDDGDLLHRIRTLL